MSDTTGSTQVLVVDNEHEVCKVICARLELTGIYCMSAGDARQANKLLESHSISVLIVDIYMPGMNGLELLAHTRTHHPHCKVILISGLCGTEQLAAALNLGAYDYIMKPLDMEQLVEAVHSALAGDDNAEYGLLPRRAAKAMQMEAQLRQASLDSIRALVHAVEAKDPYTRRHSEQVAFYATALAEYITDWSLDIESIRIASLLHDIGKIGVPDRILTKPGPLTDEEFEHIRRHPVLSGEILSDIPLFAREAKIVRHHHERWDGRGYPDGLAGEAIPRSSRVIHVADSIDAMLMARTYKEAYSLEKTLEELERGCGTQFDPHVATKAIEWCRKSQQKLILQAPAA